MTPHQLIEKFETELAALEARRTFLRKAIEELRGGTPPAPAPKAARRRGSVSQPDAIRQIVRGGHHTRAQVAQLAARRTGAKVANIQTLISKMKSKGELVETETEDGLLLKLA